MPHPLDSVSWNSLTGAHAPYSVGTDTARRYAKDYSPIIGFADPLQPDFNALAPHCDRGEHFFRFRFMAAGTLAPEELDQIAFGWQRPPLTADFTRGMKNRALRKEYAPPAAS